MRTRVVKCYHAHMRVLVIGIVVVLGCHRAPTAEERRTEYLEQRAKLEKYLQDRNAAAARVEAVDMFWKLPETDMQRDTCRLLATLERLSPDPEPRQALKWIDRCIALGGEVDKMRSLRAHRE